MWIGFSFEAVRGAECAKWETDWTARTVVVDFSFLEPGVQYSAQIFTDGYQANQNAEHYKHEATTVNANTKLTVNMAVGGGFVVEVKK